VFPLPSKNATPVNIVGYLIGTHPRPEVSVLLVEKLNEGEVSVDFVDRDLENLAAINWISEKVDGNERPINPHFVIQFNINRLSINNEDDVLRAWLFITHENVHLTRLEEQARNGTLREYDSCEESWETEFEAELATCKVAVAWGVPNAIHPGHTCYYSVSKELFKHAYFNLLQDSRNRMSDEFGQKVRECSSTWARLAGHPHPEAFR